MFDSKKIKAAIICHTQKAIRLFIMCMGVLFTIILIILVLIGTSFFPGSGSIQSSFHPFKSEKHKKAYMEIYNQKESAYPVPFTTQTVCTSYGDTFIRISGPEDAPVLVLLPGASATSLIWIENIQALSEHFRVMAVDNIYDFGKSIYRKHFRNPDDFVFWLEELFEEMKLEKINLAGYSYGGWITSQYTLHFPERVEKAVWLAPAATVLPLSRAFLKKAIMGILPFKRFTKNTLFWVMEDMVDKDKTWKNLIEEEADFLFLSMRSFKFKQLPGPTVLTDYQLQKITTPTLCMVGDLEKIYSGEKAIERLKKTAPEIQTQLINNAGHGFVLSHSRQVNKLIIRFLKQ